MVKKGTIARAAFGAILILILLAIAIGYSAFEANFGTDTTIPAAVAPASSVEEAHPSFLYGRVAVAAGTTYEGRLRWGRGRGQEAFWGDYFNGVKSQNPWAVHLPAERLGKDPTKIFGFEVGGSKLDVSRPFMARFGDIARIESAGQDVRLTLKSGTVLTTNFSAFNDLDDGVRVWDRRQGVLDVGARQVRTIDFLAAPVAGPVPPRLHGTVRTLTGGFTGFVQWNRNKGLGTDELAGRAADGDQRVRFDTIRSIARKEQSSLVTLLDGREILLTGVESGQNLGIYVDDPRFGRVLVSWDSFERLDFSPGGSGPAYGDFPRGLPLSGIVTTRTGRRLAGRLVYDLDESETTETLDAPAQGVDYTIPFGLITSIVLPGGDERARVALSNGEQLQLERRGDLGEANGGMLIFVDGRQRPEYVLWADVERIDFTPVGAPRSAEHAALGAPVRRTPAHPPPP
jgi:hypothetical protein